MVAALSGSLDYFSDVDALLASTDRDPEETVRVKGTVVPGSIDHDVGVGVTRFELAGEQREIAVVFAGAPPPLFAAGREVVVSGRLRTDGVFEAYEVLTKCPSKYEARRGAEP